MSYRHRRGHKRNSPKGAYSDRYGPRTGPAKRVDQTTLAGATPSAPTGPMLHGMPLQGIGMVTVVGLDVSRRG